jgi:tetratricopeptide (TPR) repeat protein
MIGAGTDPTRPHPDGRAPRQAWGLAALLVLLVCIAGLPAVDAPWLQGDEHIFIVNNPEVTGAGLSNPSLVNRLRLIFRLPPVEDLYQPLPILTYAVQWALWPNSAAAVRLADVLLHAFNALLLWRVLRQLLARLQPRAPQEFLSGVAWVLALLWAVHPVLVSTWAADMGRTHMMSATFALLSLRWHLRSLALGGQRWFLPAILALLGAMLCKPIVGWVLLVAVLEGVLLGWRRALGAARLWIVAVVCAAFAILTYWTSQRAGLLEDAAAGLFGDPLARSALAVWLYVRNLVAPFQLSWWHPPDPRTHWANPFVWLGLLLAAASVAHAAWGYRRSANLAAAVGWAWCWALLLPVIGLVGAREAAATDRYLYQPLMGVLCVFGAVLLRLLGRLPSSRVRMARHLVTAGGAGLAAVLVLSALPHTHAFRSTIRRGEWLVRLNPGDPRALEALANAYNFATNRPLPADDLAKVPAGTGRYPYFLERTITTLRTAAAASNLELYFPGPEDRAPFHRRLSNLFKLTGQFEESLAQARIAHEMQPDVFFTWLRLAHAYHGLGRWDEAQAAYKRCETLLPDDPGTRATHFTDFGYLLLFDLERPTEAVDKFRAAVETGVARDLAYIGLARCEILVGHGATGRDLVLGVLDRNPQDALAGLTLALYHLSSRNWDEAAQLYAGIAAAYTHVYWQFPWYYEALRGLQSAALRTGRLREAVLAWDEAVQRHPSSLELRAFRLWALACEGRTDVTNAATALLADDPSNALVGLTLALQELRAGRADRACDLIRGSRRGVAPPRSRAFDRALVALRVLRERGDLPAEAQLAEAVLYATSGDAARGRTLITEYLRDQDDPARRALADGLLEELEAEGGGIGQVGDGK